MMNNKGFVLIVSYMVVLVMVILATAFSARSIGERRVADKERDISQALWLAEAGVDRAVSELPDTLIEELPKLLSGSLSVNAYYSTQISQPPGFPATNFLITSKGGVPGIDEANPNNAIRKISVIVERPLNPANPGDVTSAIAANGDVVVKGNAQVNGDIDDNAVFDFEDIFGVSKETLRNQATHHYVDPANNIMPVDYTTWVDIDTALEMKVSESGWSGSGILVVDGDLTITGGHFSGIIWVIGTLRVSGNPVIDGALFVESGAEFETTLTGNPTVNFDSNAVSNGFTYLPSELPPNIISWKED